MANSISFIGSFRKADHYAKVKEGIQLFKKNGIKVNSPKGSLIKKNIENFVIFDTDDDISPSDIQMITLDKIINSDVVFVCDVDGYVGRTTCYEIGVCLSRRVPLYFLEAPKDLPIPVPNDHILTLDMMLKVALNNREAFFDNTCVGEKAKNAMLNIWPQHLMPTIIVKRLVVCGSMQFWHEMHQCQNQLKEKGIEAVIPKDETDIPSNISEEDFRAFKRKVSNAYLKKIREKETGAVLVFNATKKGIPNYIGANTFVELAMAFSWSRKIYLLYDIYKPYEDELLAWDVICLHGDINRLVESWETQRIRQNEYVQMSLFENEE